MKAPKDHWTIQIEVTNACIHHCSNCTRLCGHHQEPFFMEFETFCKAVDSVLDHPGLIGVMGGEPTLHPRFADMCRYLHEKLPKEKLPAPGAATLPTDSFIEVRRRQELDEYVIHHYEDGPRPIIMGAGLWTTITPAYKKNYEIIQDVFRFQSLNDHTNASYHQPILISRKDMGIDDDTWLKLREHCWVNQQWSSSVTPKGCFFCEVAAALDMLYDGPGGLPIEPGWWKRDIGDFKEQFRWCELCGIPLKTFGRDAREGVVDVSAENVKLLKEKKTAKYVPERLNVVKIDNGVITEESKRSAADYHGSSYINDAQERISRATPIYADKFTGVVLCPTKEKFAEYEDRIRSNLLYLDEIYITVDGVPVKVIRSDGGEKCENRGRMTLKQFLSERKDGTYFVFMTPEIELGEGFRKLAKCVVNPGTLHMVNFSAAHDNTGNPYIANAAELKSGICALMNNNALSLKEVMDPALDEEGLKELWNGWSDEKKVELSSAMDGHMYGVGDPERQRETEKRRLGDAISFLKNCTHKYGLYKTTCYIASFVRRYGLKLTINKMRSKIF